MRGRVIGAGVDSVSDGIGCVKTGDQERMLILGDILALMSSPEMGLLDAVVH